MGWNATATRKSGISFTGDFGLRKKLLRPQPLAFNIIAGKYVGSASPALSSQGRVMGKAPGLLRGPQF